MTTAPGVGATVAVGVGLAVAVSVGVAVLVGVGLAATQPVLADVFAVPGVTQCGEKSTLFTFVSIPSGLRDMPTAAVLPSSISPAPEPSVYGPPVSTSWETASTRLRALRMAIAD